MNRSKRVAFATTFAVILSVATLVGLEVLASFYVPAWPARVLSTREPAPVRLLAKKPGNILRRVRRRQFCRVPLHPLVAAGSGPGAHIHHVDLRTTLDGVPRTYRKMDGHWAQRGKAIVAERIKTELDSSDSRSTTKVLSTR